MAQTQNEKLLVSIDRSVYKLTDSGNLGEHIGDIDVLRHEPMTWDEVKTFVGHDLEEVEHGVFQASGFEHEHPRATLACQSAEEALERVRSHGGNAVYAEYTVRLYTAVPAMPARI